MTKERIVLVCTLIVLLCLALGGCGNQVSEQTMVEPEVTKIPVTVEVVHKNSLEKTIPLGGLLRAQEEVFIAAKNPAFKITDVLVEIGDYVTSGTPLVLFDARELDLQLEQAQLAYQRNMELYEIGAVSKYQLEQTENAVKNLELQKENCILLSTINGVVASVTAVEGQLAGGIPLVSIVDIDNLELPIQVGETYISKLKKGTQMEVHVPAVEEETFSGVITLIPPQINAQTKAYPVTVTLSNKKGLLKDGMYGEVCLVIERKEDILVIPRYAVVDLEEKQVVYVVENDIAKMHEVELGLTLGDQAEVVKGLNEGERLVVEGQYALKDGSPVIPMTRGESK